MTNKIEATIYIQGNEKPIKIKGTVDEMHYVHDFDNLSLEIRNTKIVEEKTAKDYIETDGKSYWKLNIADYIDDLIQERLKVAKEDEWVLLYNTSNGNNMGLFLVRILYDGLWSHFR